MKTYSIPYPALQKPCIRLKWFIFENLRQLGGIRQLNFDFGPDPTIQS